MWCARRNEDLGRAYGGILAHLRRTGRAAPGCKVSDAAKAYKANPTTNDIICRNEPLRGFNFARFNQRARFAPPVRRTASSGGKDAALRPDPPRGAPPHHAPRPTSVARQDSYVSSGGRGQGGYEDIIAPPPALRGAANVVKPESEVEGTLNPRDNTSSMPVSRAAAPQTRPPELRDPVVSTGDGHAGAGVGAPAAAPREARPPRRDADIYARITPHAAGMARNATLGDTINEPEVQPSRRLAAGPDFGASMTERRPHQPERSQGTINVPHADTRGGLQHQHSGRPLGGDPGGVDVRQVKVSRGLPLQMAGAAPRDAGAPPAHREAEPAAPQRRLPLLSQTLQATINEVEVSPAGGRALTPTERKALQQHDADMQRMQSLPRGDSSGRHAPEAAAPPSSGGVGGSPPAAGSMESPPPPASHGGTSHTSARSPHERMRDAYVSTEPRLGAPGSGGRSVASHGSDDRRHSEYGTPGSMRGSAGADHPIDERVPEPSRDRRGPRRQALLSETLQATVNAPEVRPTPTRTPPAPAAAPAHDFVASRTGSSEDSGADDGAAMPPGGGTERGLSSMRPPAERESVLEAEGQQARGGSGLPLHAISLGPKHGGATNGTAQRTPQNVDALMRTSCEKADSLTSLCRQVLARRSCPGDLA